MILYDDYIELKNKKPLGTMDEITHYSEPPDELDNYGGRLLDEYMLIDVDDGVQSSILVDIIQELGINTIIRETSRGHHFYFKASGHTKNKAPTKCAIGLTIEIKTYGKNKQSYEPIKVDGKIRKIIKNSEVLDEIPYFLKLMRFCPDWINMGKGDGRNQSFLNYQNQLAKKGIEYEVAYKIGKLINDYVLPEPLDDNEFNTVWRKEVYPSTIPEFYSENGGFLHNVFSDYMIKEYHIVNINKVLHVYDDGVYKSEFESNMIQCKMIEVLPRIKAQQRNEALKYMQLKAPSVKTADPRYVLVKNGIYDFVEDTLMDHDPSMIFVNKINYDYYPNCFNQVVDDTLHRVACHDEEVYELLTEIIGYCLYRKNPYRMCPILVGHGSNGKSTYIEMVQNLLGEDNYSSVSLTDLKNNFKPAEISNKLANLGDDIDNQYIKDTSIIKKLITGETILVEHKGTRAFRLQSYATMIFTANDMAMVSDKSAGWASRIKIIPFNARFTENDPDYDPFIDVKLRETSCMEYLLSIAIESMRIVLMRGSFRSAKAVVKMTDEYNLENNSILKFFKTIDDMDEFVIDSTRGDIYLAYEVFCKSDAITPLSAVKLGKELSNLGYETFGSARKYKKM